MRNKNNIISAAAQSIKLPKELRIGKFHPFEHSTRTGTDGTIDIVFKGEEHTYAVEIRSRFFSSQIAPVLHRKKTTARENYLLVSQHINRSQGEALRDASVEFIDAAGNCFLDLPNLHLLILGNPSRHEESGRPSRMFTPSGLKIIFAFLTDPRLTDTSHLPIILNKTYRQISELTGISPGTITWTRRDLEKAGFMHTRGAFSRQLVRRRELLDQWVTSYGDKLRPKLMVARFRSPSPDWWRDVCLPDNAFWGGEVAAAKLTEYLNPGLYTLYLKGNINNLILDLGLQEDSKGDVEILEAFWGSVPKRKNDCVHPLLVYADLIASDIGRNLKVARRVYDQELRRIADTD